jgi:hypothetical protein
MKRDIEQLRQALLAANDTHAAAMVAAPSSEITVYPTPFLQRYRIYRVLYKSPYKPILLYLGFAPDRPIYYLAGNPSAYPELAQADQVDLSTLDLAITYITVFLEVTRNMYELVYQVNSIDQIRFLRKLSPAQVQAKEALTAKYRATLTAPGGEVTADGYLVTAYVVRQQELERHTFKVGRNGDLQSQIAVLEQRMPVVIGI